MSLTSTNNHQRLTGLICLDGPDATGKTTLAGEIAKATDGEIIHLTWTPKLAEVMDDYRVGAIKYATALSHDRVVVLERPWMCHAVYSSIYRDGFDMVTVQEWKRLAESAEAMNIVALPSDANKWIELYRDMTEHRHELHGSDLEKMESVYHMFRGMILNDNLLRPEPSGKGVFDIYDYQQFPKPSDYVNLHVIPHLIKLNGE